MSKKGKIKFVIGVGLAIMIFTIFVSMVDPITSSKPTKANSDQLNEISMLIKASPRAKEMYEYFNKDGVIDLDEYLIIKGHSLKDQ